MQQEANRKIYISFIHNELDKFSSTLGNRVLEIS